MPKTGNNLIDGDQYREVLGHFASGVTIVTTVVGETTHGMTASAFVSVSLNPPLILISVDNRANLHNLLSENGRFGVSILAEDQEQLSNHFAGMKVEGIEVPFIIKEDVSLIDGAIAHVVADVVQVHSAGDHTLYLGGVRYLESFDSSPLLFFHGKYHYLSPGRVARLPDDDFSMFSLGNFVGSGNYATRK